MYSSAGASPAASHGTVLEDAEALLELGSPPGGNEAQGPSSGPPDATYYCSRCDGKKQRCGQDPFGLGSAGPAKRSKKVGCPYQMQCRWIKGGDGKMYVEASEVHGHFGHTPGSAEDQAWRRLSDERVEQIKRVRHVAIALTRAMSPCVCYRCARRSCMIASRRPKRSTRRAHHAARCPPRHAAPRLRLAAPRRAGQLRGWLG